MTQKPEKTIQDFPEYAEAAGKLSDLESQLTEARSELQVARDHADEFANQSEASAVTALLTGGAAVEAPSISALARNIRILESAATSQRRKCEELTRQVERDYTSASERSTDDGDTLQLIELLQSAIDVIANREQRRVSIRRRFNGSCSLPSLNLTPEVRSRLVSALSQFRAGAAHFGVTK